MIAWAVETLVASTLLMVLVLAVRRPLREAVGPQLAYWLWSLPLLRMILPPLPGNWHWSALFAPFLNSFGGHHLPAAVAPFAGLPPELAGDVSMSAAAFDGLTPSIAGPVGTGGGEAVLTLLVCLWAAGAIAFIGWHVLRHSQFCRDLVARSRSERVLAQGRVRMVETDAATGPLAFGLFRKYVAFPGDFSERYDAQERDLALAHELGHHVRGDLYANWAALIVLACHWFNPIAWRAFRAFRADQEMACDALVLAGRPGSLRHAYGRAIVKSAHGGAVSAACHLHTINEVKGRLKMLARTRSVSRRRMAMGGVGMAAIALAGLGMTASGTSAAEVLRGDIDPIALPLDASPSLDVVPDESQQLDAVAAAEDARAATEDRMETTEEVTSVDSVPSAEAIKESVDTAMRDMPDVSDENCGAGDKTVEVTRSGGKVTRMVICRDRINAMASRASEARMKAQEASIRAGEARAEAMHHKQVALAGAMQGLVEARARIAENEAMPEKARAEALAGIDSGIADLRRQQGNEE